MKIVIMDGSAANPGDLNWKPFESLGDVTAYDITPSDRIIEHASGAQAVITNKTPFTEEILEQLPDLKYSGVIATSYFSSSSLLRSQVLSAEMRMRMVCLQYYILF